MFITLFHSFLLVIQLFISDSSSIYNKKLKVIGQALQSNNYRQSKTLLIELHNKTLFNNYQIQNLILLTELKEKKELNILSNNEILNSIMFFESGNKLKSLELLKHEISKNHSDTCIKWFEILNAKISRRNTKTILTNKEEVFKNQFNKIEALDILNLMKNKEKYIKYE